MIMKKAFSLSIVLLIVVALNSCSTQNPNPNINGNNPTYTQGSTVTDIDGNVYPTIVTNCGQAWMQKNLNVSHYRNGDIIPQVTDPTQWYDLTTGAWCYYNNDPAMGVIYGKLYNWYAVNDSRGLAPTGYHVPSDTEWTSLETCLGGSSLAGGAMKEATTIHWLSPNTEATNISGLTFLPGGTLSGGGSFDYLGSHGYWWSSTESTSMNAWDRDLYSGSGWAFRTGNFKPWGISVRCLRD